MNFVDAARDIESLEKELLDSQDSIPSEEGKALCTNWQIAIDRRIRRRRVMSGEDARDTGLSAKEEITRIM